METIFWAAIDSPRFRKIVSSQGAEPPEQHRLELWMPVISVELDRLGVGGDSHSRTRLAHVALVVVSMHDDYVAIAVNGRRWSPNGYEDRR